MAQSHQVTLDIDDEDSAEPSPRNFRRLEPPSREPRLIPPAPPHRNSLGDRLNSVFREIRPLVENARMVSTKFTRMQSPFILLVI